MDKDFNITIKKKGREDRVIDERIYNIFREEDLKEIIEKKIKPKAIKIEMKKDREMITKIRTYAQRYDIPIIDNSEGEISLEGSKIEKHTNGEEEEYSLDLMSCNIRGERFQCNQMTNIISIRLPTMMKILPDECFFGCIKLTNIELPKELEEIGESCFFGCQSLKTIEIPSTLHSLPAYTFGECTSLETITYANKEKKYPCSITQLGAYCFSNCYSLKKIDLVNKELIIIPKYCFINCISLEQLDIATTLKYIGKRSFKNIGLPRIQMPGVELGKEAFIGSKRIERVVIHPGTKRIPDRCFMNCINLREIYIPTTVTEMGRAVFEGCSKLTYISNATQIKYIYEDVFKGTPLYEEVEKVREKLNYIHLPGKEQIEYLKYLEQKYSQKDEKIQEKEEEIQQKQEEIQEKEQTIMRYENETKVLNKELNEKSKDIIRITEENKKYREIQVKMKEQEEEINRMKKEKKQKENEHEREINRLKKEIEKKEEEIKIINIEKEAEKKVQKVTFVEEKPVEIKREFNFEVFKSQNTEKKETNSFNFGGFGAQNTNTTVFKGFGIQKTEKKEQKPIGFGGLFSQ